MLSTTKKEGLKNAFSATRQTLRSQQNFTSELKYKKNIPKNDRERAQAVIHSCKNDQKKLSNFLNQPETPNELMPLFGSNITCWHDIKEQIRELLNKKETQFDTIEIPDEPKSLLPYPSKKEDIPNLKVLYEDPLIKKIEKNYSNNGGSNIIKPKNLFLAHEIIKNIISQNTDQQKKYMIFTEFLRLLDNKEKFSEILQQLKLPETLSIKDLKPDVLKRKAFLLLYGEKKDSKIWIPLFEKILNSYNLIKGKNQKGTNKFIFMNTMKLIEKNLEINNINYSLEKAFSEIKKPQYITADRFKTLLKAYHASLDKDLSPLENQRALECLKEINTIIEETSENYFDQTSFKRRIENISLPTFQGELKTKITINEDGRKTEIIDIHNKRKIFTLEELQEEKKNALAIVKKCCEIVSLKKIKEFYRQDSAIKKHKDDKLKEIIKILDKQKPKRRISKWFCWLWTTSCFLVFGLILIFPIILVEYYKNKTDNLKIKIFKEIEKITALAYLHKLREKLEQIIVIPDSKKYPDKDETRPANPLQIENQTI